ncbi:MAG: DUF4331 family protein [Chloroflexia bacterium]
MKYVKALHLVVALALILSIATFGSRPSTVSASSHREAPNIIQDPTADNTDVYAFVSPDKPDTVTLVANFIPFEHPGNGPNFYQFDDNVRYAFNIDNVGDAQAHITYQFRFTTQYTKPEISDYNDGPIESIDSPNLNVKQRYTVTRVENGKETVLGQDMLTPPYNVGVKSTPNYEALSNAGIHDLSDGSKVFAGPADDSFFLDFSIFDALTVRKLPGNAGGGIDSIRGYNVHTIVLQVPIARLTANGAAPTAPTDANAVIGVWSTTSRQTTRVLQPGGKPATGSGEWIQISRLGNPLVNEAVVPSGMKDLFNNSKPADDAQFLSYVTDPSLAKALNKIYGIKVPPAPRDDLVAIFLTGIPGATMPPTSTLKPSEELRLNMAVPPSANPNPLGVVGGDMAGFPNGRRLADDVFDIEVKGVAGAAYPLFHPDYQPDPLAAQLGDGVDRNDVPFRTAFPYVALAHCATDCDGGETGANTSAPGAGTTPQPTAPPAAQTPGTAPATAVSATEVPTTAVPATVTVPAGMSPGMPKTGTPGLFQVDHLGDIYGVMIGLLTTFAGLVLLGGWAVRRKGAVAKNDK